MRIAGSFNQAWLQIEGQDRAAELPASGADCLGSRLCAHRQFGLCSASRPGACLMVFCCRFEVRPTVQGEGLATAESST